MAAAALEATIQQLLQQSVQEGLLDDQFLQLMQLQVRKSERVRLGLPSPRQGRSTRRRTSRSLR